MQNSFEYLTATAGRLVRKFPYVVAWNRLRKKTPEFTRTQLHLADQRRAPSTALFFDRAENRWYTTDDVPQLTLTEIEKLKPQTGETKP